MEPKPVQKVALPNIQHIIVVASGKGGVGKSTIAANLAVSLSRQGYRTALVDADLYGPSIPLMFGIQEERPRLISRDNKEIFSPVIKYGVKIISIGFFLSPDRSLIWRGPLVTNALLQLFTNTEWGEIDYMIVDFPPGTGDIQITTTQKLNLSGAIIVTTPQEIALSDARKAAAMFTHTNVNVPIIGIIENMAWFTPAQHPDEKYYLFGKDGGYKLSREFNVPLLGQIPLVTDIEESAERGVTIYNQPQEYLITLFDDISNLILDNMTPTK
ncbi:MAG: Mrp/NBP35 family ATP-binding protein [Bacteroidales bacterium]|jgi:ATP-binding protein involved in chromosome partitioning|nr:Mrp/NBP35 family ATP-binding protein [Bacteroidales bacterium]MDD4257745.1 Mrp/NBP35 family ATP-binding protein [Bacteroidales bacterium]MDD4500557.1 Mrp/NBP35 family ATP-binding protein [Bacteroidales bacterium]